MRKLLIVGNWKMNKISSEAGPFVRTLADVIVPSARVEVVLAPPFTALPAVKDAIPPARPFRLAAQNLFWEDKGAFTGEVSAPMLIDLSCEYVLVGHSERRQHFAETDEGVNRKIHAALRHTLHPILCLGETLQQRENDETELVVTRQLVKGLEGVRKEDVGRITIAYEPVWAIGTGRAATTGQAESVHDLLRRVLVKTWGTDLVDPVRVLYGGSVTPANAGELLRSPLIDGALVGGACLDAHAFATIVHEAQSVNRT